MNTFFIVLSGIVVIAYSTPIFLTVVLPLGIVYYLIQVGRTLLQLYSGI